MDIISKVRALTDLPLVMHGGSGVSEEGFKKAIANGIRKQKSDARLIHFSSPRTKLFLYNYLNEINHHPAQWLSKSNFLRMKAKFAAADMKFDLYHNAGALLRRCGMDNVVEKLKTFLH